MLSLSACKENAPNVTENTPPAEETCAAALITPLIGEPQSALDALMVPEPLRIILPGMTVTMDHRPERTNIEVDDTGRISRVWCG
ncbi:hypothetical protein CEW89_14340 [Celeribacter ethanolicus]|uniref:Peptidase inhibitor I78 family protein n=1 Tax=Celeribacter ethanolicus TaxID=1758178 RepID=A0A291GDL4_9RHOB|nr:hypothetical protein CEW89_14340 [Celeribacter ethanolicus]